MAKNDLTLPVNDLGFVQVRANLVLIHPKKGLLFHTFPQWDGDLLLFGGRVQFGETLEDACHRELKEELGLELNIVRTWWDCSFFKNVYSFSKKYNGAMFHEFAGFGLYYLPDDFEIEDFELDGFLHQPRFVPLEELSSGHLAFVPPRINEMILNGLK